VNDDPRARRIVVVADSLFSTRLDELREGGFGVMQLPPPGLAAETAREWIDLTAEQIAEYRRTGHEVMLVDDGVWGDELNRALADLGAAALQGEG
jgi:hypothetical protein